MDDKKQLLAQIGIGENFLTEVLLMMDINPKFHSIDSFQKEFAQIIPSIQKYTGDIKQHLSTGLLGKIIPSIKD